MKRTRSPMDTPTPQRSTACVTPQNVKKNGDLVRTIEQHRTIMGRTLLMRLLFAERRFHKHTQGERRYANLSSGFFADEVEEALEQIDGYMARHHFTTENGLYHAELLDTCFDALEQQHLERYCKVHHYVQQDLFADDAVSV